jgi:hypothetical protein
MIGKVDLNIPLRDLMEFVIKGYGDYVFGKEVLTIRGGNLVQVRGIMSVIQERDEKISVEELINKDSTRKPTQETEQVVVEENQETDDDFIDDSQILGKEMKPSESEAKKEYENKDEEKEVELSETEERKEEEE